MGWIKTFKFLLISFWRFHMGYEYEHDTKFSAVLTRPGELLLGRASRFIKALRRKHPLRFESLVNSVLIGLKSGLPRPEHYALKETQVGWLNDLFKREKAEDVWELAPRIRKYVRKVIGKAYCTSEDIIQPRVPSTSSNYVNGRNKMGCVGTCLVDQYFREHFNASELKFTVVPSLIYNHDKEQGEASKILLYDDDVFRDSYRDFFYYSFDRSLSELPLVAPVALSEALKVRMITRCPPWLTMSMNSVIDPLRKYLRGKKVFRLTGQPITELIVDEHFQHLERPILSGDYVGSTDNLYSWVSECIVDELMDTFYGNLEWNFRNKLRGLFKQSLTGFQTWDEKFLDYPERGDTSKEEYEEALLERSLENINSFEPLEQTRGQLMGSVTSFPILCLANYALCRMAMEANPHSWGCKSLLVNGDDCVFEASKECYDAWCSLGSAMGLSPSPGKVDYQVGRLQMNSRVFLPLSKEEGLYRWNNLDFTENHVVKSQMTVNDDGLAVEKNPRRWRRVPITLMGIAAGMKRSSGGDMGSGVLDMSYEDCHRDFLAELEEADSTVIENAKKYFDSTFIPNILRSYQSMLNMECWTDRDRYWIKRVPFNVPKSYGGLGLPGIPSRSDFDTMNYMYHKNERMPERFKTWLFHDKLGKDLNKRYDCFSALDQNEDPDVGPLYWYTLLRFKAENVNFYYTKSGDMRAMMPDLFTSASDLYKIARRFETIKYKALKKRNVPAYGWAVLTAPSKHKYGIRCFSRSPADKIDELIHSSSGLGDLWLTI